MRLKIIKIGNSRGIMLSKQLISQYGLADEVEVVTNPEGILIKPVDEKPRQTWTKQFEEAKLMGQITDKELLEGFENDFDKTEWTW